MAYIEKRKGPHGTRYRVRLRDPLSGVLLCQIFDSKTAALDWLHEQENSKRSGTWRDRQAGKTPVGELVEKFVDAAPDLAPATVALYRSVTRNHIQGHRIAARSVAALRPQDVRDWISQLQAEGVGVQAIRVARRLVARVLRQAQADGTIGANPVDAAPPPRLVRGQPHVLNVDEVQRIAEAIDPAYRALVLAAAYCGLRFGEVAALRLGDVDMLRRRLVVSRALSEVGGTVTEGQTKSGKTRMVTMPAAVVEALAAHLEDHEGELIFTAPDGGYIRRTNWRRRVWAPALGHAGLPHPYAPKGERCSLCGAAEADNLHTDPAPTPHDLRHFGAAVAIAAGAHPKAIQERLGHASITTTLNVYGHLFPSLDEELAAKLDTLARGARPQQGAEVVSLER